MIDAATAKKLVRKVWTPEECELVCELYADTMTKSIALQIGCSTGQVYRKAYQLGLAKSEEFMASPDACRLRRGDNIGAHARFAKGHVPANKGLRRPGYAPGRMAKTQFKPGTRSGFAENNWKPIGTVCTDPEGFLRIKVRDRVNGLPKGWDKSIWPLVHHRSWEEQNGPIPAGHKLVFRDGNRGNCAIENLELITDAEMMRRNTIHNRYPQEMVNTIMLLGAVKRKLRKLNAKEHDDGSAQPSI